MRRWLPLVLAVLLLGGCTPSADGPERPGWRAVDVPGVDVTVADVAACDDGWYAVGSAAGHPAAWHSPDGRSFTPVPVAPVSLYGPEHLLYAVACAGGHLAAIGRAHGGAHGNPRTGTWFLRGGTLTEQAAPVEQYGGPLDVGVFRISAGPGGFLIAGNHPGATAWLSPDGETFQASAADPDLLAFDGTPTADGPVLIGQRVWRSDGTRWTASDPGPTLHRVSGTLAGGVAGGRFELWDLQAGKRVAAFGSTAGPTPARVLGVAVVPGGAYVAVGAGARRTVWHQTADEVREVAVPFDAPHVPGGDLLLAAGHGQWVTGTGDGRLWFA
ncbi:hypothetical protein R8Z50_24765 [Longispora sp. K20-0274]|uniref:hypothetical protein n=1 Tax=Longispora sp. K20-0274 TaxID=3088255 RepID=UPI003999A62C